MSNQAMLKSLSTIWVEIANDFKTDPKSISTFLRRIDGHGLPYLLVMMPALGKELDHALDTGVLVIESRFKLKHKTKLPVFLYEHFIKVFNKDGSLREYPEGIRELRQLLLMFYKFTTEFSPEMENAAVEKFHATDQSVKTSEWHWSLALVRKHFASLFPDDPMDIRPHHSNGQTADFVCNSQKRAKRRYIPSLNNVFNFSYFFQSELHYRKWKSDFGLQTAEPKARLEFVPKDSRGPRSICMEPHERMFVQKGLQQKLYEYTESSSPARGKINFTDQTVNRRLAQQASIDRRFSTIDLKDASDLVSWELVQQLLRDEPIWLAALRATRSAVVETSIGDAILKKFAPMGSALCFPIEAFLFWSIVRCLTDKVWVYGDDLIVPTNLVGKIMDRLELYGLAINREKSLFKGYFRESCGGEYYRGSDISIVRCKSLGTINYIAFCNLFSEAYSTLTADKLVSLYEHSSGLPVYRRPLSERTEMRGLVYYTNFLASSHVFFKRRWNEKLHAFEVRVPSVVNRATPDKGLTDEDLLFDWMTRSTSSCQPEMDHIELVLEREFGDDFQSKPRSSSLVVHESGKTNSWIRNSKIKFRWVPETVLVQFQRSERIIG